MDMIRGKTKWPKFAEFRKKKSQIAKKFNKFP
jgi:hypothetical protein